MLRRVHGWMISEGIHENSKGWMRTIGLTDCCVTGEAWIDRLLVRRVNGQI